MASILDLLRKRNADREMSAADYVTTCVRAEATGESRKIDIAKLESAMIETATTLEMFEQAVERERRLTELRRVASGLPTAAARFNELSAHAKARRDEVEREVAALNRDVENAERAASQARGELDRCRAAEAELKKLLESPARRQARLSAKPGLSKLRNTRRALEEEIASLQSSVDNVGARVFDFPEQRDRFLADRQAKLDRAQKKLADVAARLAQAELEAGEVQPEPAAAAG